MLIHASVINVINGAFTADVSQHLFSFLEPRYRVFPFFFFPFSRLFELINVFWGTCFFFLFVFLKLLLFFCSFIVPQRGEPVSEKTQESESSFRGDEARTLGEGVCGGKVQQGGGERSVWKRPRDGEYFRSHQTTTFSCGFPVKVACTFPLQNTKHHSFFWLLLRLGTTVQTNWSEVTEPITTLSAFKIWVVFHPCSKTAKRSAKFLVYIRLILTENWQH